MLLHLLVLSTLFVCPLHAENTGPAIESMSADEAPKPKKPDKDDPTAPLTQPIERISPLDIEEDPGVGELDLGSVNEYLRIYPWTSPANSITVQTGYGADWGTFYAGAATGFLATGLASSAVFGGFGLGNSTKYVGLEVSVLIANVDEFGESGLFNLKLHRRLPWDMDFSIGREELAPWGQIAKGTEQTYYTALTKRFQRFKSEDHWFNQFYIHAGLGNGRFRPEEDNLAYKNSIKPFLGVSARIRPQFSVSADWTFQARGAVGISVAPFRTFRMAVGFNMSNIGRPEGKAYYLYVTYAESVQSETFPLNAYFR